MTASQTWAEHRRVLRDVIGDVDLSRPALVQAMMRSEREWDSRDVLRERSRSVQRGTKSTNSKSIEMAWMAKH
ncbi:hypothetical protein SFRURICE_014162 [Spodoptera frugiperda]|nr:hypothetical protein SFRURICE_014162 [Spodoptera frugiperda]